MLMKQNVNNDVTKDSPIATYHFDQHVPLQNLTSSSNHQYIIILVIPIVTTSPPPPHTPQHWSLPIHPWEKFMCTCSEFVCLCYSQLLGHAEPVSVLKATQYIIQFSSPIKS